MKRLLVSAVACLVVGLVAGLIFGPMVGLLAGVAGFGGRAVDHWIDARRRLSTTETRAAGRRRSRRRPRD
ncbi:hypothetical protein [Paraconexibacter algicola]|uniref:hypothetical protein n=1 Tax=Paraconexibacter algicola TaxID=2133960 RepID=UPI0011B272D0|nr:hypothetical protein [Paraconexibacter algicola]